jgi:diphthine-ammonia ligase
LSLSRKETYEEEFKAVARRLKQTGVDGIVFGDIDIYNHLDWVIQVCNEVGMLYMEPLWHLDRERVLREFIGAGFNAIVINARADIFGGEWLGRRVDETFIEDLQKLRSSHNFDICGESGEYHTFVTDGPIFNRRINILSYRKVLKEGFWRHWLLEISEYSLVEKDG